MQPACVAGNPRARLTPSARGRWPARLPSTQHAAGSALARGRRAVGAGGAAATPLLLLISLSFIFLFDYFISGIYRIKKENKIKNYGFEPLNYFLN